MARTVRDAALLLSVMAGPDERDPQSLPDTGDDFAGATQREVQGLRIAWSADLGYAAVDPEVRSLCSAAVKIFENFGCVVDEAHPGFEDPEPLFLDLTAPAAGGGVWSVSGAMAGPDGSDFSALDCPHAGYDGG